MLKRDLLYPEPIPYVAEKNTFLFLGALGSILSNNSLTKVVLAALWLHEPGVRKPEFSSGPGLQLWDTEQLIGQPWASVSPAHKQRTGGTGL